MNKLIHTIKVSFYTEKRDDETSQEFDKRNQEFVDCFVPQIEESLSTLLNSAPLDDYGNYTVEVE